jgi:hypothetical protein
MGNGKQLRLRLDPKAHAVCDTCAPVKPGNVLGDPYIGVVAVQPPNWHIEPDAFVENVAIPHLASAALMHQGAGLRHPRTARHLPGRPRE